MTFLFLVSQKDRMEYEELKLSDRSFDLWFIWQTTSDIGNN